MTVDSRISRMGLPALKSRGPHRLLAALAGPCPDLHPANPSRRARANPAVAHEARVMERRKCAKTHVH